jgi:hypothetical protein
MNREPVRFVCVATGDLYGVGDLYVSRLHGMLSAWCPAPFSLTCYTDRPRNLPAAISQIDCSGWSELRRPKMRPTTLKLGLFNPAYVPLDEFFYLDLTVVIRQSLGPLLDAAASRTEPLVILKDWTYDGYNSSVMRIRNWDLAFIYEAFAAGETYTQRIPGDQDFIHAAIRTRRLQRLVATFPPQLVTSFKFAAQTARRDREASRQAVARAVIVKFAGRVKLHNVLRPYNRLVKFGAACLPSGAWGLPFSLTELDRAWKVAG